MIGKEFWSFHNVLAGTA